MHTKNNTTIPSLPRLPTVFEYYTHTTSNYIKLLIGVNFFMVIVTLMLETESEN